MTFETRHKLVNLTKKLGVYRLGFYCAVAYDFFRHQKLTFEAKRRANGWIDKRYAHLLECKDAHLGEKCFIVATGPSLTVADVEMLKGQYTFSVNSIVKLYHQTGWRPTYYAIIDPLVVASLQDDADFQKMDGYFAADCMARQFSFPPHVKLIPFDTMNPRLVRTSKVAFDTRFSGNAYAVVYDGGTVVYAALQLAVYMGFREIYLLGCDCDYSGPTRHFAQYMPSAIEKLTDYDCGTQRMLIGYQKAKEYADAHGIKIYNATRGGKLEIFERVSLERAVESRAGEAHENTVL